MKHIPYIIVFAALLLTSCVSSQYSTSTGSSDNIHQSANYSEHYISTYYPMAVEQMEKHGIPASITLAQALLEGGAGKSDLVKEANNHFGVKADSRWQGRTYSKWDNGKWCKFRVYKSTQESFEDHSKFLLSNSRYDFLFKLDRDDYEGWAKGLKKAGYAEDPQYPTKLINLIERYGLHKYDSYNSNTKDNQYNSIVDSAVLTNTPVYESSPMRHELLKANGLIYTIAADGDSFEEMSAELGISKRKLRKYNDLYKGYTLKDGDMIYLERKNAKARKGNEFHTVKQGESLYYISQKYGIRLKKLYKMNPMYKEYAKLKVGDILRLR